MWRIRFGEAGFVVIRNPLPLVYCDRVEDSERDWYFASANNALVRQDPSADEIVWLPAYGHGNWPALAATDAANAAIWRELGFEVRIGRGLRPARGKSRRPALRRQCAEPRGMNAPNDLHRQIYRQAALDRLASPERLDRPGRLVGGLGWPALALLVAAICAALVWVATARAPVRIACARHCASRTAGS